MDKPMKKRVALVTGGGSGIGRAVTEGLLKEGARVIIASRRSDLIHRVASELNASYPKARAYPYVFDIRNAEQTSGLVRWAEETLGGINLLVNNTGVSDNAHLESLTDEEWLRVIETNLQGAMWLIRAVLPKMIQDDFGDIVNIVGQAGRYGYADVPAYCASKHGILGLARAVDHELLMKKKNVRLFNLCPSLVDVEHTAADARPREGAMHVRNIVRTLLYCLSLDRNVRLGDLDILAR